MRGTEGEKVGAEAPRGQPEVAQGHAPLSPRHPFGTPILPQKQNAIAALRHAMAYNQQSRSPREEGHMQCR